VNLIYSLPPVEIGQFYASAPPKSWAMDVWGVSFLRNKTQGQGVTVAVLDTGIDDEHPDFAGLEILAKDFTNSRYGTKDLNGHGTHCAGTIASNNPNIGVCQKLNKLIVGKVLGDSGSGGDSGIAKGIRWAREEGADIISMSLGSSSPSSVIKSACDEVASDGAWIFAAAGNEGQQGVGYPGRFESCLSVAAVDKGLIVADFSSRGAKLDTCGPGVDIVSCKPKGGHQSMNGTSMATPFVAGLMALYLSLREMAEMPEMDYTQLRDLLYTRSVDLGRKGDDNDYGPGWINPLLLDLTTKPDPYPVEE
jgi:subtilisin